MWRGRPRPRFGHNLDQGRKCSRETAECESPRGSAGCANVRVELSPARDGTKRTHPQKRSAHPFTSAIMCSGYLPPAAASAGNTSSIRRKSSFVNLNCTAPDILFQILPPLGPRNRHDIRTLRQHPSQRQLRRPCIPSRGQSPPPAAPDPDSSENSPPETADSTAGNHPPASLQTSGTAPSKTRGPADCTPQTRSPTRDTPPESRPPDRASTKNIPSAAPQSDAPSPRAAASAPKPPTAPDTAPSRPSPTPPSRPRSLQSACWDRRGAGNRDRWSPRQAAANWLRTTCEHSRPSRSLRAHSDSLGSRTIPNFVASTILSRLPLIARPTSSSFLYGP